VFANKGWRVVAFEVEPINYTALKHNLADQQSVVCINKAVSDVTGAIMDSTIRFSCTKGV